MSVFIKQILETGFPVNQMSDHTKNKLDLYNTVPLKRKFSKMPLLDFYVLREFLIPFSVLLFAFSLLFVISTVFQDLNEFLDNKAGANLAVRYFLLTIPGNIRFIFPITVLLSSIYTIANFGRHREITAMRASGISMIRIGMPMYIMAFLVTMANFWFNEFVVPTCETEAKVLIKTLSDPNFEKRQTTQLQYLSSDKMRNWFFGYFNSNGIQEKVKLKIFKPDPIEANKKIPVSMIDATQAEYTGNEWIFYDAKITEFTAEGLFNTSYKPEVQPLVLDKDMIPDNPAMIEKAVSPPENLSTGDIWRYLRANPNMPVSLKRVYQTFFFYRLAFPWICFISAFLALPLATKNERSGIFIAIANAVVIVLLFYVLSEIFKIAGQSGYMPPFLAGFAPLIMFLLYSTHLVRKAG